MLIHVAQTQKQGRTFIWFAATPKSPETRAALRFFAERRIRVHFVDLLERPAARGELLRFVQLPPHALEDTRWDHGHKGARDAWPCHHDNHDQGRRR